MTTENITTNSPCVVSAVITVRADTPVGPLSISVVSREAADVQTFGGPPLVYDVSSAASCAPGEFTVDGHPYGGWLRVSPEGEKIGGRLYRAGVHGRRVEDGVEADVCRAVVDAMEPHLEAVTEAARDQLRRTLLAGIARWDAAAERLRQEHADAEINAARCRAMYLEQFGEVT